ncbi:MAG: TonB family protein [Candidatus Omnitrophica bacterium]|nr:TonB family protein [Candidatus Omnitrophota bacterium]
MKLSKTFLFIFLVFIFNLLVFSPVIASQDSYYQALMFEEDASEGIDVVVGDIQVIEVGAIKRVSIRDPNIADIQKAESGRVIVAAKSQGETLLTVWTQTGKKEFRINVISEDLPALKKKIKEIIHAKLGITDVTLRENKSTGKIMLLGSITQSERDRIEQIVAPFADKIEDLLITKKAQEMVEIDVQILEINKDDTKHLGVDWMDSLSLSETAPAASKSWKSLWQTGTWSRGNLSATLHMLIKEDKGRVLSRPKLLCLNGEEAELLVGGELPVITEATTGAEASSATSSASVEYKEYGIKLLIKPFVLDDQVYLSITAEVSDWVLDTTLGAMSIQGTVTPAFTMRRAQTVVNVDSGDTVFLGGLIDNDDSDVIEKFPGLSKIPILGALFRSKNFQSEKTELFITLTPKIINLKKKQRSLKQKNKIKAKPKISTFYQEPRIPRNLQNYALEVQRMVSENVSYPRELSGTGWKGRVVLYLEVDQYGEVKNARIKRSSGYKIFDQDALELVDKLVFYPFPSEVQKEEISIEIPIVYREGE